MQNPNNVVEADEVVVAAGVTKSDFYRFIQEQDEGRFEFDRGRIVQQMAGGTLRHARIGKRFADTLSLQLGEIEWIVTGPDRGVDTPRTVRYADVVVEPVGAEADSLATAEPVLLVEVLSKDSSRRDLGTKPPEYTSLPTLLAYIVASQTEVECHVWVRRPDDGFEAEPVTISGWDAVIEIPALGVSIPLREIYRGIL